MKKDKLLKLMQILQVPNVESNDDWVKISCLFAKHTHSSGRDNNPSAAVSIHSGKSIYNCFSCGTKFPIDDALVELYQLNKFSGIPSPEISKALIYLDDEDNDIYTHVDEEFEATEVKKVFKAFPEDWLYTFDNVTNHAHAMDYLATRKGGAVPLQVIKDFKLVFDQTKQHIGFPYWNMANGVLAGMRGRCIDPFINSDDTKKHLRHHDYKWYNHNVGINNSNLVWYREGMLDVDKPLIVVEGEFDCARVYQCYRNCTAILTAMVGDDKLSVLCQFTKGVYWMTDNDEAGLKSRKKARAYFKSKNVFFDDIFVPEGYKDPGEVPIKWLAAVLKEYVELDPKIE